MGDVHVLPGLSRYGCMVRPPEASIGSHHLGVILHKIKFALMSAEEHTKASDCSSPSTALDQKVQNMQSFLRLWPCTSLCRCACAHVCHRCPNLPCFRPPASDGTDINALQRSTDGRVVATADDFGGICLFNCPCVTANAPRRRYGGHSECASRAAIRICAADCLRLSSLAQSSITGPPAFTSATAGLTMALA